MINRLEFYTAPELKEIILRAARVLDIEIQDQGTQEIAKRSRGTPRIANRLLRRVRDFAQVKSTGKITREVAQKALTGLEIDELGLDKVDRKLLKAIIQKFSGGPVGVDSLAASIHEDSLTVEDVYEPYLLQLGFIERTPRGRVATSAAYKHLGIVFKKSDKIKQDSLFKEG